MSDSGCVCGRLDEAVQSPETPITYNASFREWGLELNDGGTSVLAISHCPWCGVRLPISLRDRWFEEVEALGFEAGDPEIPLRYASSHWWAELPEGSASGD